MFRFKICATAAMLLAGAVANGGARAAAKGSHVILLPGPTQDRLIAGFGADDLLPGARARRPACP